MVVFDNLFVGNFVWNVGSQIGVAVAVVSVAEVLGFFEEQL